MIEHKNGVPGGEDYTQITHNKQGGSGDSDENRGTRGGSINQNKNRVAHQRK